MAELANDSSIAFGQTLYGVRQGVLNLATAGLFHLLEQQLVELWNDAGVWIPRPKVKLDAIVKWMKRHTGIDLTAKSYWERLDTLHQVANTAKHGEGDSARRLRKLRPDLFTDPVSAAFLPGWQLGIRSPLVQPLAGEGLYVTEETFRSLANAAVECFEDLATYFEEQGTHEYPNR
jgi:hypothetical protein